MKRESIKTLWRFGYLKLFDDNGFISKEEYVSLAYGRTAYTEWRKLLWRIYWRQS